MKINNEQSFDNTLKRTLEKLARLERAYNSQVRGNPIYQNIHDWMMHSNNDITAFEETVLTKCYER
jgi:hypothetical protein